MKRENLITPDVNKSLLIIHYSCQRLNDSNEGISPRVTSIAVLDYSSFTIKSFSIHLVAEVKKCKLESIEKHYDELEKDMLTDFNNFVAKHQNAAWLHWNMKSIHYGFELLAHRYEVLTGEKASQILASKRHNLDIMISDVYGRRYVEHPRMQKLLELNHEKSREFLTGAEEAAAFENSEYIKLHRSTLSKVESFHAIYVKLQAKKLKTTSARLLIKIDRLLESTLAKILGFIAVILTLLTFI